MVEPMTECLGLGGIGEDGEAERVLEVGTGAGYQAALLGQMGCEVHTIERNPRLADMARDFLAARVFLTTGAPL